MQKKSNAWLWIPTLYFASGLPYHAITSISDIMYKDMGIGNAQIAMYTSLLLIPWTIKPLWSPFVEMISTRRKWTLASQLLLAICFAAIALAVPSRHFLLLTLAALFLGARQCARRILHPWFATGKAVILLRHTQHLLPHCHSVQFGNTCHARK